MTSANASNGELDRAYEQVGGRQAAVDVVDVFTQETHRVEVGDVVEVREPDEDTEPSPVVVSVPHSGVLLPARFADRFPREERTLVEIDLFSHLLYEQLPVTQLVCRLAPYFLDMNRARDVADEPQVPRHLRNPPHEYYTVDDRPILRRRYTAEEAETVLRWYDCYHQLLDTLVSRARRQHGWALLVDGHSMTSVGLGRAEDTGEPRDNFVIGTLGRASADESIIDGFVGALRSQVGPYGLGLTVAEDEPYSGGFITRTHHDPANEVHALQVEVSMDTYMYEADEEDLARRYTLKQHRLDIVRDLLAHAVDAASAAASRR